MSISIAALADTHAGDCLETLPSILLKELIRRKPDLILHAGDITQMWTIHQLNAIAKTIAVKGDNDALTLPSQQRLTLDNKSIVIRHGDRPREKEKPSIRVNKLLTRISPYLRWWNGYLDDLCKTCEDDMPDLIICGHLHYPFVKKVGRTLVLNPGAVFMNGQMLQKDILPSIVFLEIEKDSIRHEFFRFEPVYNLTPQKKRQFHTHWAWGI